MIKTKNTFLSIMVEQRMNLLSRLSLENNILKDCFLKKNFDADYFLKSLLNLLQHCTCFMFCFLAERHVES